MSSIATEESSTVTGSPMYRLKHKWTVKDFGSLYLVKPADNSNYPRLNSTWFASPRDSQLEFRLKLWPRGWSGGSQNDLCLFLEMNRKSDSPLAKSVIINFKFSLLNERNEKCHSREFRQQFAYPSDNSGWANALEHTVLQEPANGLLSGDTLTIFAEIDVFPESVLIKGTESLLAKLKVASIENVRASLARLLDSGEHSDVLLVVEGSELRAHKNLLSAGSPVFRAMFKSEMTEKLEGKVIIRELKVEIARAMLRFIYTGEVPDLMAEYAEELLMAADKYDVTRLKELCGAYLCGQVNPEKVAALLAFADRHSVPQLKSTCVEYIRSHWEEVMARSENWTSVQDLFTQELRQLKLKEGEDKKKSQEESESAN